MALSDEPEELLDLVDERDVVIGTVTREEVAAQLMQLPGFVRSCNLFIVNSQGKYWIPRRSPNKKIAPNGLDYSAGEHVGAGETYIHAMLRGMREELNLEVTEDQLEHIAKFSNASVGVPYFNDLYRYQSDEVPHYNTQDFVSWEWLTLEELEAKLDDGEPAKRDMILAVDLLLKPKK